MLVLTRLPFSAIPYTDTRSIYTRKGIPSHLQTHKTSSILNTSRFLHLHYSELCSLGYLSLSQVSQTTDGRSDGGSGGGGHSVSTTSHGLVAGLALPDTSGGSLGSSLTTERAVVLGVLLDLHLLGLSSQRRTVSHTELTGDADLLSSFSPGC